jgi:hypothetical protein
MDNLIKIIINNLTDDLLKNKYKLQKNKNKFTGHCYIATETLYYLLNDEEKYKYTPAILHVNNATHWFLKNKFTNEIIDITKEQFDFELDYSKSKNCSFLTKFPSKRTLILINRIYEKNCN